MENMESSLFYIEEADKKNKISAHGEKKSFIFQQLDNIWSGELFSRKPFLEMSANLVKKALKLEGNDDPVNIALEKSKSKKKNGKSPTHVYSMLSKRRAPPVSQLGNKNHVNKGNTKKRKNEKILKLARERNLKYFLGSQNETSSNVHFQAVLQVAGKNTI